MSHICNNEPNKHFCFIVGKNNTHLAHVQIFSPREMLIHLEILSISVGSRIFNPRISNTIFRFSDMILDLARRRLNSVTNYFIVVNKEIDSPKIVTNTSLLLIYLRNFHCKDCIIQRLSIHFFYKFIDKGCQRNTKLFSVGTMIISGQVFLGLSP